MTGVTLAQKMLKTRDTPIILYAGYSETVSAEKAQEVGIRAFVMKPIVKRELAETIRRMPTTLKQRHNPGCSYPETTRFDPRGVESYRSLFFSPLSVGNAHFSESGAHALVVGVLDNRHARLILP